MLINLYTLLLVGVTLAVVLSRRTMYSILYLILLFVLVAFVVMSFKIDFIGLIFIIVYVGAIATLFLFIVMMLGGEDWVSDPAWDVGSHHLLLGSGFSSHWIWGLINKAWRYLKHTALDLVIALIMGLLLIDAFSLELAGNLNAWLDVSTQTYLNGMFETAYLYGVFFYNYWYIPFLLAAVVLLVAMLGSIILTTRLMVVDSKPSATDKKEAPISLSPFEKLLEQKQREEKAENAALPVQIAWSIGCFIIALFLKNYFIWSPMSRNIFVAICCVIYLIGSVWISKYAKRRT